MQEASSRSLIPPLMKMETRLLLPSLGMNMVFSPLSREEEPEAILKPLTTSPSSILSNQSDKNKEAIRH